MPEAADQPPPPPKFIRPQLSLLVETPSSAPNWARELKHDGYRIHARLARREARLLTRTGLDWTDRYEATAKAISALAVQSVYLDGELWCVRMAPHPFPRCRPRPTINLVYVVFDLLFLNGEKLAGLPLLERREHLKAILKGAMRPVQRVASPARRAPAAWHPEYAPRRATADNGPLRISAQSLARYLGSAQLV
jgi:ATP-dependent DNA ligase